MIARVARAPTETGRVTARTQKSESDGSPTDTARLRDVARMATPTPLEE